MTSWIEDYECMKVGDIGFVVAVLRQGVEATHIQPRPARTNRSHEAKLRGWCGETQNVGRTACGCAEVLRRSVRDLDRVQVRRVPDDDPRVVALWEELGE